MAAAPTLICLLGSLACWLARRHGSRLLWGIRTITALTAWSVTLGLTAALPTTTRLSTWQPASLFGSVLELALDEVGWSYAFVLASASLSLALMSASRRLASSPRGTCLCLAVAAMGITAVLSANLLTIMTMWALMDLLAALGMLGIGVSWQGRREMWSRMAAPLGSLMLVLLASYGSIPNWSLNETGFPPLAFLLVGMAAFLRLGLAIPEAPRADDRTDVSLGPQWQMASTAAGLSVLTRLLEGGVPSEVRGVLQMGLAFMVLLFGWLWVSRAKAVRSARLLTLCLSASAALMATQMLAPAAGLVQALGALCVLVGVVGGFAHNYLGWHRVARGLLAVMVAGAPGTPAWVVIAASASDQVRPGSMPFILIAMLGLVMASAGLLRQARLRPEPWPPVEDLSRTVFSLGLLMPLLVGLGLGALWLGGVRPISVAVFGVVVASSAALVAFGERAVLVRLRAMQVRAGGFRVGRLLEAAMKLASPLVQLLRDVGGALEGEGGMLWMYVIVLLIVLGAGLGSP